MPTENVVPIDADAALTLHRRTRRFRWFVAALTIFWLAVLVPVLALTPLPPLGPLVVLAGLLVLAEHRFVLFGDETSMSASIIVAIASVFVFADSSPIAGPMLVASFGGLYLPHLRDRQFGLVLVNSACFALAAASAVGVSRMILVGWPISVTLSAGALALAYWATNSVITGSATAIRNESAVRPCIRDQFTSNLPILFLVIAVAIAGLVMGASLWATVAVTLLAMTAFELHLQLGLKHSLARTPWITWPALPLSISVALLIVRVPSPTHLSLAALAGSLLLSACGHTRDRLMPVICATATAAGGVLALRVAGGSLVLQGMWSTVIAYAATVLLQVRRRAARCSVRLDAITSVGLVFPTLRECAGIALAGTIATSIAVFNHSGLERFVVAESLMVASLAVWNRSGWLLAIRPERTPAFLETSVVASH